MKEYRLAHGYHRWLLDLPTVNGMANPTRVTERSHSLGISTIDAADAVLPHSWDSGNSYGSVYYRRSLIGLFDDCLNTIHSR